jgi:hypothetical protein
MKKYLVDPGWVTSVTDGDRHYIGAVALMRLYGVDPRECVIADRLQSRKNTELIRLTPRSSGNYVVPKKRFDGRVS